MRSGKIGVTTENIFPVIKKFLYSDPDIETYEKMLFVGYGSKYESTYKNVKDTYVKAVKENRYIGMISGNAVVLILIKNSKSHLSFLTKI